MYTYIWLIFMVNTCLCTIHGSYGSLKMSQILSLLRFFGPFQGVVFPNL